MRKATESSVLVNAVKTTEFTFRREREQFLSDSNFLDGSGVLRQYFADSSTIHYKRRRTPVLFLRHCKIWMLLKRASWRCARGDIAKKNKANGKKEKKNILRKKLD